MLGLGIADIQIYESSCSVDENENGMRMLFILISFFLIFNLLLTHVDERLFFHDVWIN